MLYVCLITAPGQSVESVEVLDAECDGTACNAAMVLARECSAWHGYELWRDGRKLAAFFARSVMPTREESAVVSRRLV